MALSTSISTGKYTIMICGLLGALLAFKIVLVVHYNRFKKDDSGR